MAAKFVLLFVVVCALSGKLEAAGGPRVSTAKLREAAMVIINDCKEKVSATDADIAMMKEKKVPTSHEGMCMVECLLNTANTMKNGKFNKEVVLERHMMWARGDKEKEEKIKHVADDCEKEANTGKDSCEHAAKLAECFKKHGKDAGMKLPAAGDMD